MSQGDVDYLHGFVHQHDSCFKIILYALMEDPECWLESNSRLSAEKKRKKKKKRDNKSIISIQTLQKYNT